MVQLIRTKALALTDRMINFPIVLLASVISFTAWYITYTNDLVLIYNDAMSHLNLSRLVIDNLEPGFAQLGGVWLPLNHVLSLTLVWNDWAWHSGFAGSFFSMAAFVISVWAVYKTVLLLTRKKVASFVGGLAFALNLNMLYLQSTPMTEPLYVVLFALSGLVFTLWILHKSNVNYLLLLGALGFLQVLTRYDGWFVVAIEAALIGFYELFVNKKSIHEALGKLLLFCSPVALGICMWLLWNLLIFNDPLFFALGDYSARSQQTIYEGRGALVSKGNMLLSLRAYWLAMTYTIGIYALTLAGAAAGIFLANKQFALSLSKKMLILLFFSAPVIFNIIALYLGFSILYLPEINPTEHVRSDWFNVRYGVLALPLIAVLFGLFASWRKLAIIIALEVIMLQSYLTYTGGIATITDGKIGTSAFDAPVISEAVKERVKPGDTIIMSIYSFNPVAFRSGIQLDQIVHEGVSKKWQHALKHPAQYGEWVLVAHEEKDQVYKHLILEKNKEFEKRYKLVFTGNNASLYQLIRN